MAIMTLEEVKTMLQLEDLPDLTIECALDSGSDIITDIADTSDIKAGDTVGGVGVPSGSVVVSKTADTLTIDASATVTDASASITISGRGSEYDEMITLYIPIVEQMIKDYCNNDFLDDDGDEAYPISLQPVVCQMIYKFITSIKQNMSAVSSETYSRYSVSYATAHNPQAVLMPTGLAVLNMYKKPWFI